MRPAIATIFLPLLATAAQAANGRSAFKMDKHKEMSEQLQMPPENQYRATDRRLNTEPLPKPDLDAGGDGDGGDGDGGDGDGGDGDGGDGVGGDGVGGDTDGRL
ncbi:hypothetical protein PWT90_03007 [Aphanocladium album]|nr:hypothetical protein PWT90_03007 [Aphanocladium album]